MILLAIVILLVIIVLANIVLGIYNMLSPPCGDINEYFQGHKRLPDGSIAGLGSIPSGTDRNYVGLARTTTGIPGVIGLTNYSYSDPNGTGDDELRNPIFDEDIDGIKKIKSNNVDGSSELQKTRGVSRASKSTGITRINNSNNVSNTESFYNPFYGQVQNNQKNTQEYDGAIAKFETEMEGIGAPIYQKNKSRNRPSTFSRASEREGYQNDDEIDDDRDGI